VELSEGVAWAAHDALPVRVVTSLAVDARHNGGTIWLPEGVVSGGGGSAKPRAWDRWTSLRDLANAGAACHAGRGGGVDYSKCAGRVYVTTSGQTLRKGTGTHRVRNGAGGRLVCALCCGRKDHQ